MHVSNILGGNMTRINDEELAIILGAISSACNLEAAALLLEENKNKKRRSFWVKPFREPRDSGGSIQSLLKEYNLFYDDEAYTSFMRMDERCFSEILRFVKSDIERTDTPMRKCIPAEEKLAATLRFLATGETFKKIAENSRLSASYLRSAVLEVCHAIYGNMKSKFLQFPDSKEKWLQIANEFEMRWQFPLCLGALDEKHIAFKPRKKSANLLYNQKGLTSIVLLALADAHCKFLFIDVGCDGQISDGGVLDRSDLMYVLENDNNLPEPKAIGNKRTLPYVVVANNAFPNGKRMLTPYSKPSLTKAEIIFNTRLSHAMQNIERAFGILSNRFRVLQTKIQHDEVNTTIIIKACCVLHNFLLHNSERYSMDHVDFINADTDIRSQNTATTKQNRNYEHIRSEFNEYFCNEGKL